MQYTLARMKSLLEKAKEAGIKPTKPSYTKATEDLYKTLYRFPEIVERASQDYSPQHVTTFLIGISGEFNSFYGREKIIDLENKEASGQHLAFVLAVERVISQGLYVLGIPILEKM